MQGSRICGDTLSSTTCIFYLSVTINGIAAQFCLPVSEADDRLNPGEYPSTSGVCNVRRLATDFNLLHR